MEAYDFHNDDILFVLTVGEESVEIPLLTDFFSYRSNYTRIHLLTCLVTQTKREYTRTKNVFPRA